MPIHHNGQKNNARGKWIFPALLVSNDLIVLNLRHKSDLNAGIGRDGKTKVKRLI